MFLLTTALMMEVMARRTALCSSAYNNALESSTILSMMPTAAFSRAPQLAARASRWRRPGSSVSPNHINEVW